ncbi:MAG: hypothetical protein ABIQ18_26165 [Umezawaea sp.]
MTAAMSTADQVAPVADEPGGPFGCSLERARSVWSDAELALGIPAGALESADRAVAMFETTPAEQRNMGSERMARLLQVLAHLRLGDPAAAHLALTPVLATAAEHRIRPLMARLADIDAAAASLRRATDPQVLLLRNDITEFRRGLADGGATTLQGAGSAPWTLATRTP